MYEPFPAFADWAIDFDPSVVDSYAERLKRAKESSTPEALNKAVEIAKRYAAVDTGAIEGLYETDRGFTRTIAVQSEFWERALQLRGEGVKRSIDDALAGYDYVLDAVTGSAPITRMWIRELHAVITEHQESVPVVIRVADHLAEEERPLPHGQYKQIPNNPMSRRTGAVHYYAPVEDTPSEMARLVDELQSVDFLAAHPVVQAAYAHYAYVRIHPFTDGNGRVARALASVYLYRNPGVPLVIFADQRDIYIDALEEADAGHASAFVQFIAQRVIDTVNMVTDSLELQMEDDSADIAEIEQATQSWLDEDVVLNAQRLQGLCASALGDVLVQKGLPPVVDVQVTAANMGEIAVPNGYIVAGPSAWITVSAVVNPSTGQRSYVSHIVAATFQPDRPQLLVVPGDEGGVALEVWLREIDPSETTSLRLRIDTWAQTVAMRFIKKLNGTLSGYRLS